MSVSCRPTAYSKQRSGKGNPQANVQDADLERSVHAGVGRGGLRIALKNYDRYRFGGVQSLGVLLVGAGDYPVPGKPMTTNERQAKKTSEVSAAGGGASYGNLWCRRAPTETCTEMHLPLHYEQAREGFERFEQKFAQIIISCRKIVHLCLSGGSSG